tara:strand:+ start:2479 stop:2973 length:495 start_codon:yes stop_codon:yes gene_type:complete
MAAKNPYTTVGMPASISNSGLTINLVFGFRYSAVSIALNNPKGPASNTAIMVINIVPHTRGINPNCPLDPTLSALKAVCGDHVVLKKKSCGDTSKKNFTVSYAKLAMIAKVIKIVNQLHILKKFFKKSSLKPGVAFLGPIHINIQTSLVECDRSHTPIKVNLTH